MSALYLIGPRGAGKSSVGRLAAGRLGLPLVDVDTLIEQRAGRDVRRIFAEQGEPAFRALERQAMLDLLQDDRAAVVATGGGCVLDPEVRGRLGQLRAVFWLTAELPVLERRIAGSARPSLTGDDPARELEQIVSRREPLYRAAAARGQIIDTGSLSPEQAAAAVAARYNAVLAGEDQ